MTEDLLLIQQEMLEMIEYVDKYSWEKGSLGGLDWGMESFNRAFDGLRPGLIMIAAGPNVGKSALCLQLGWKIAEANKFITERTPEKAYVLYFSLDDNATEILPRVVAMDQSIPINSVKSPKKYEDSGQTELLRRRALGIQRLKENIDTFKLIDGAQGTSIEHIERTIDRHIEQLKTREEEQYKLVVFIDNFHDISVERRLNGNDEQSRWVYIAEQLSRLCTIHDLSIVCTAELRKLNGDRRPRMEDLRESIKLEYEAKAILGCYNEYGLKGEAASIFFESSDENGESIKRPILEVKVLKNKFSDYKRRMYFSFSPELSRLEDISIDLCNVFDDMIK